MDNWMSRGVAPGITRECQTSAKSFQNNAGGMGRQAGGIGV